MPIKDIESLKERIQEFLNEPNKVFHDIHEKTMEELLETISIYQEELEFQNQELRNTQEILMQSEKRFSSLFYGTPIGLVLLNAQAEISEVNPVFLNLINQSNDKVRGRLLTDFIHEKSQDAFYLYWKNIFTKKDIEEIEIQLKSSNPNPIKVKIQAKQWSMGLEEEHFILLSFNDVTELTNQKNKIQLQNFALEQSQEIASLGTCILNPLTSTTNCSQIVHDIFGFPKNYQASYKDFMALMSDEGAQTWLKSVHETLGNFQPFTFESEIKTPKNKTRWIKVVGRGVELDGQLMVISTIQDITNEKRFINLLKKSEERYRVVTENTFNWEYWKDPKNKYVYVSPSCERITGYKPQEFINDPKFYKKVLHPEDLEKFEIHNKNHLKKLCNETLQVRIISKSGEIKVVECTSKTIFDEDGNYLGIRGTNVDVTERNSYINQIENQNRILKEIAWMQSHEIRGPVARGMSLIQFLKENDFQVFSHKELIKNIEMVFNELDDLIKKISQKAYYKE